MRADFPRREARTQLLRIPRVDWALVVQGHKTELRAQGRWAPMHNRFRTPTPVVAWSYQTFGSEPQTALLVLEEAWQEPLGAISPESLAREGFATIAEFRAYWRQRHSHAVFKPLSITQVYRVRPWRPEDRAELGVALLDYLYGRWL